MFFWKVYNIGKKKQNKTKQNKTKKQKQNKNKTKQNNKKKKTRWHLNQDCLRYQTASKYFKTF